jgi:hypothetical protein
MHGYHTSRANGAQSRAALRRAFYEEQKRARMEAVIAGRTDSVLRRMREVHGNAKAVDTEGVRGFVEKCRQRYPEQGATKRQTAHHEAGHFAAFEAEGMAAYSAKIYSGPGAHLDWGGEALALNQPDINHLCDALTLLRAARVGIAGPAAGRLLANHDGFSPAIELVEARVLVERAAGLSGRDGCSVWSETVRGVFEIIERHSDTIGELAELLERRKEISRFQPSVRKILSRIRPGASICAVNLSPRGQALARIIEAETPSVEELMEVR